MRVWKHHYRFFGATLCVGLLCAATAEADAPITEYRGEELYFSVELFGQELARGAMIVGDYEHDE